MCLECALTAERMQTDVFTGLEQGYFLDGTRINGANREICRLCYGYGIGEGEVFWNAGGCLEENWLDDPSEGRLGKGDCKKHVDWQGRLRKEWERDRTCLNYWSVTTRWNEQKMTEARIWEEKKMVEDCVREEARRDRARRWLTREAGVNRHSL